MTFSSYESPLLPSSYSTMMYSLYMLYIRSLLILRVRVASSLHFLSLTLMLHPSVHLYSSFIWYILKMISKLTFSALSELRSFICFGMIMCWNRDHQPVPYSLWAKSYILIYTSLGTNGTTHHTQTHPGGRTHYPSMTQYTFIAEQKGGYRWKSLLTHLHSRNQSRDLSVCGRSSVILIPLNVNTSF